MNAKRTSDGAVSINNGSAHITAKVPTNRSFIGVLGMNGIIDGGDYKEDGWVYLGGKKFRKWHGRCHDIRIWEPKYNDIISLYRLFEKVNADARAHYEKISSVIYQIHNTRGKRHIAHAIPHKHVSNKNHPWVYDNQIWEYEISEYIKGQLCWGFDWVSRPKRLINPDLGQLLYKLDCRNKDLNSRVSKVRYIFYHALKQALPEPTAHQMLVMTFGNSKFIFKTVTTNGNYWYWEMYDTQYTVTERIII